MCFSTGICRLPASCDSQTQTIGNHGNAGVDPKSYRCVLDP
jgi:hypothetical protein